MATLADLARQYLAQPLPDISGIFQPVADTPVEETPVEETTPGITPQLLQPMGGGDSFSVYNPDPTRTRTIKDYQFPFKFTGEDLPEAGDYIVPPRTGVMGLYDQYKALPTGSKAALGATSLLTGGAIIPAALGVYGIGKGISSLLPPNRRAILENQALGAGIALDDIGRVVAGPGNINTAENIMAGYNLNKVTRETLAKRRRVIEENMKDPVQKAAKLKALQDFEDMMFGDSGIYDDAENIYYNKLDTPTGITKPGTFQDFLRFKNITTPQRTGIESINTDAIDEVALTTDANNIVDENKAKESIERAQQIIDAGGTAPDGGYASDYQGDSSPSRVGGNRFDGASSRSEYDSDPTSFSGSF
jgi:hypothetical protein